MFNDLYASFKELVFWTIQKTLLGVYDSIISIGVDTANGRLEETLMGRDPANKAEAQ